MGVSKAEINLKRLLRAQVHQTNDVKLVHYVATMRSLLADLTGDPRHQELATIPASRARDYAHQIDLVAQKLRSRGVADEENRAQTQALEDRAQSQTHDVDQSRPSRADFGHENPNLEDGISSYVPAQSMRRRLRGDDVKSGLDPVSERAPVRVDASLQSLVQRHRELQEGLTDELVTLSAQLKDSSLMMDQALHETDKTLDSTEDAVEASLASTNQANVRMGTLSMEILESLAVGDVPGPLKDSGLHILEVAQHLTGLSSTDFELPSLNFRRALGCDNVVKAYLFFSLIRYYPLVQELHG